MTATQPIPQTSPTIQVPTSIDYTSRDYTAMVQSLLLFASQAFPDWNYNSEGDIGVALLELFAYIGDINSFYTDRVAQEAYITTATQRQSLLNIAQLLGYVPSNGTAASGTVTFQSNNPTADIVIPAGTVVQSAFQVAIDAPVQYYTTVPATCPGNGGTVTVPVSQGTQYSMVSLGVSSGQPGQSFQLPQTGVLDGSTTIYIQSTAPTGSTQWAQVRSFIDSGPSDNVFTLAVNAAGATVITFGDGVNGLVPSLGMTVYASYTTIVGAAGNLPAGSVPFLNTQIPGLYIAVNSLNVPLTSEMSGGSDAESNNSIRVNAPVSFATQQRAVSLDDFGKLALGIPGVVTASAVANHSTSVSLYVVGPNITIPSAQLQAQILEYFSGATLAGVTLSMPTPTLVAVDVGTAANQVTLQVLPNYGQQATLNAVILALNELLTPPSTSFGMQLYVASLYQAIMGVAGVEYVIIPVFSREDILQPDTSPIQFRQSEIPIAGNFYISASGGL